MNYAPAQLLPFTEVKAKAQAGLVAELSAAQARKDGELRLATLKQSPETALSEPALVVSRAGSCQGGVGVSHGLRQAQLAGDQAGEQGVAEVGEASGLHQVCVHPLH